MWNLFSTSVTKGPNPNPELRDLPYNRAQKPAAAAPLPPDNTSQPTVVKDENSKTDGFITKPETEEEPKYSDQYYAIRQKAVSMENYLKSMR
jgi:hypothetical protein